MTRFATPSLDLLRDSEEALRLVLRCLEDLGVENDPMGSGHALQMHLTLGLLDVSYQLESHLREELPPSA